MRVSIIGYGNMAKAIVHGLITLNLKIRVASPSLTIGVNQQGIVTHDDNLAILHDASLLILAVKPMQMDTVFNQIKALIPDDCLLISIAAGVSIAWFAERTDRKLAIIRAMPNIAAAMQKSATPLFANQFVTPTQKINAEQIFAHLGLTTWVAEESLLNTFTALSGSGPAYVLFFMEAMILAAKQLGLSEDIAQSFTLQTVQGTLSLASNSGLSLGELRKTVTSPAGTTAAAIEVFTQQKLEHLVFTAMSAAQTRAEELGKLN